MPNLDLCCENCFADEFLAEHVRAHGSTDTCGFCGSSSVSCIDPEKLYEKFEGILSLYEPVQSDTHFRPEIEDASSVGDSLFYCIELDGWGIFNEHMDEDVGCELLNRIRCLVEGHHGLDESDSGCLWAGQDRRIHHVSEEEIWWEFSHHIKHERRFIIRESATLPFVSDPRDWLPRFLPSVRKTLANGTTLFRARSGPPAGGQERFPSTEMSAPPQRQASAGRANPAGISVLYTALEKATAVGEMRASVGSRLTVATCSTKRDLTIADLSSIPPITSAFAPMPPGGWTLLELQTQQRFLRCLDKALSDPVLPHEKEIEYVPTQYVAELIGDAGYDGIMYRSSLVDGGRNLVLFKPSDVEIAPGTELVTITSVTCGFEEVAV